MKDLTQYYKDIEASHGKEIADEVKNSVFVAGAKLDGEKLVTAGGRVLGVTAVENTLGEAIASAYKNVEKVTFSTAYYRSDIGARAMKAK